MFWLRDELIIRDIGSGKEYLRQYLSSKNLLDLSRYVVIYLDHFLVQLPEFQSGTGLGLKDDKIITAIDSAAKCHSEASYMLVSSLYQAIESKYHIIYDGTGGNLGYYRLIYSLLRANEYKVKLLVVKFLPEVAKIRSKLRADITGRYVPDEIVTSSYYALQRNLPRLIEWFRNNTFYENNKDNESPRESAFI